MGEYQNPPTVWFEESVRILNSLGKRWGVELTYYQDGWWGMQYKDSKTPTRFPSYSTALTEFLNILERRMVDYVKPVEYKD